jgi:hypothetical protein
VRADVRGIHRLTQVRVKARPGARRSTRRNPEDLNLLQELDNSLPDFENLDEEQRLKFVKAIRGICGYFDISEAQLRSDHFPKLRSTVTRLSELYDEHHTKDAILSSAILIVKLHIESNYLDDQDANLVHNLTGLHIYPGTIASARTQRPRAIDARMALGSPTAPRRALSVSTTDARRCTRGFRFGRWRLTRSVSSAR